MMLINKWNESDIQWLKENRDELSLSLLSKCLGRSEKAVRHKINWLKLPPKKKNHYWSKEEDNKLVSLYSQKISLEEIATGMNRSPASVRVRASRILKAFRSDRHLKVEFWGNNFYAALKRALQNGSAKSKCCLCDYDRHIQLHHKDGNRVNNNLDNISSLCPNHHVEVTYGDHTNVELYCVWWRVYSDNSISKIMTNKS